MKVLGYSENGVYVQVSNEYAEMCVDFNTSTKECIEVDVNEALQYEECTYNLSSFEKNEIESFFNSLVEA